MEYWNMRVLEYWSIGFKNPLFHHSIIPLLIVTVIHYDVGCNRDPK